MKQIVIAAFIVLMAACADEKLAKRSYPVIDTHEISELTAQGVTFNGEILDIGDGVTEYGFVFNDGFLGIFPFPSSATKIPLGTTDAPVKFSAFANRGMAAGVSYNVRTYAISTKGIVVLGEEKKFVSLGSLGPEVKDINPKEASIGDMIVITGTGFSTVLANNQVSIGEGGGAFIVKAKADTLWVQMPAGASVGDNTVVVRVGQQSVTATQKVKLLQMTITSVEPAMVFIGDSITVKGTNFPIVPPPSSLKMFGVTFPIYKPTRTQLKTVLTQEPSGVSSTAEIIAGTQTVKSTGEVRLFPPKITAISPEKGVKDTEVTITGDYFNTTPAKNTISIGGTNVTVTAASRTSLKFKVPATLGPGSYSVSVTAFGQTTVSVPKFEIPPPVQPTISNINPMNGTWGTEVTINGTNFSTNLSDNVVTFTNSPGPVVTLQVLSASATQIRVKVPHEITALSSTVQVTVKTLENRFATFTFFTFDPPVVSSFTPLEGKAQSIVTINGNNFNSTKTSNVVKFGDLVAEIVAVSSTQITAKVPSIADATVTISVTTLDRTATSLNPFHVISPWRRIKDFPGAGRAGAASFVLNNEGYVGLGYVAGSVKSFYKYNPTNDTWTEVQAYSTDSSSPFADGAAFEIGGFAYVGKGEPEPAVFRKYDPGANTWTTIAPLPVNNISNSVGFAIGGKGYVATGSVIANTGGVPCCFGSNRIWEYDPVANAWTEKNSLPVVGRTSSTAFTINSRAFVFGGWSHTNSSIPFVDLFEFVPATNTWETRASYPTGRWDLPASFAVNGKGYILGAGASINPAIGGSFAVYDPTLNTWQSLPGHPVDFYGAPVTFVIGSKAYLGLGSATFTGLVKKEFWEFDPSKL